MAFKLRSGNNTPFKQIGRDKETAEQYNARVMAEYKSNLQSHSDSTASYGTQIKIDKLLGDAFDIHKEKGWSEKYKEKHDLAVDLHFQNLERGVYPIDRPDSTPSFYMPGYDGVRDDDATTIATGSTNPDDLRPKAEPVKPKLRVPNNPKTTGSQYYDPKTKEYRVRVYAPKQLSSGKWSSIGRGEQTDDISLAEWNNRNDE